MKKITHQEEDYNLTLKEMNQFICISAENIIITVMEHLQTEQELSRYLML